MNRKFHRLATTCFLGLSLMALPAIVGFHTPFSNDEAYGKGNGSGGGGNGNSGGNGNNGNNGNGGGKGNGGKAGNDAASKSAGTAAASKKSKDKEVADDEDNGKLASKLGALNAAHASAQALAHASPNSRVGKIAAYRDANVLAQTTAAEAAEAVTAIATATQAALAASPTYQTALGVAKLAADALSLDPLNQTLIVAKTAADAAVTQAASTAIAADPAVAAAQTAATIAATAAVTADADALKALEAAANKPVTPEVRAQVDALLLDK